MKKLLKSIKRHVNWIQKIYREDKVGITSTNIDWMLEGNKVRFV